MRLFILLLFFLTFVSCAEASPPTPLCYQTAPGVCTVVTPSTPLPISITGGVTAGVDLGTSVSVANPQITGDATSGFYTPAASQVAVTIAGSQIARWSSAGENITGALGVSGAVTAPEVNVSGNASAAAWTTNGIGLISTASTYTDTSSSGTVALQAIHNIAQPTLAASAATTYTESATLRIASHPATGTNVTQSRTYALLVQGTGGAKVEGSFKLYPAADTTSVNGRFSVGGASSNSSWTTFSPLFAVTSGIQTDTSGTGTIATRAVSFSVQGNATSASSAVTLTDATSAYIGIPTAGTNVTITNPWSLITTGGIKVTGDSTSASLDLGSSITSLIVPIGTTTQRPTASNGMIRYNSTTPAFEFYNNSAGWISFGIPSGDNTTTGASLAIGISALATQTAAGAANYRNTAIGYQAIGTGTLTTAAIANTAVGYTACAAITSGAQNTCMGMGAGGGLTSGGSNTFLGVNAGNAYSTTSGSTMIGQLAGQFATGASNTGVGSNALNNATGAQNTAVGNLAGQFISSGTNETAVGYLAMTGITGTKITGAGNTAIGASSGNVLQGSAAANTLIGNSTGLLVTTGTNNTIIGSAVGSTVLTTGTNNILIGVSSAVTTAANSTSNTIQIGGTAATGGAGSFTITGTNTLATEAATLRGTFALTDIASDATHTDSAVCQDTTTHIFFAGSGAAGICLGTSSIKFKKDVVPIKEGVAEIMQLKPVNFYYKKGYGDNGARHQYGFIAEDVYKIVPELTGLDKEGKPQSVDYMAIVPVLVKAVQEQQKEIDGLKARIR